MNLPRSPRFITLAWIAVVASTACAATKSTTRRSIEMDANALDAYVGRYQLDTHQALALVCFRGRLYASLPDWTPFSLSAESKAVFFNTSEGAEIAFERDAAGKVTSARIDLEDIHQICKKISDDPYEEIHSPEVYDSPRLASLAKEIEGVKPKALKSFWESVQDDAPLVEPFAGDVHSSWVTFLYRGDAKTRSVQMLGGPEAVSWDGRGMKLMQLADTNVWFRSVRVPNDARFVYTYAVNLPRRQPDDPVAGQKMHNACARADALNPTFIDSIEFMPPVLSLLELPDAPPQAYIHAVAGTPRGTISKRQIQSEILKQQRTYSLYTPPGYDSKGEPCPLVVMFDGNAYHSNDRIPGPTIIDNLIAAKKIPPIVVAFVDQKDRQLELTCSEAFAAFVARELVPRIRAEQHIIADARRTSIGGLSSGGLMASYCALKHSDVFGNVISQSGAYWIYPGAFDTPMALNDHGGVLIDEFVKSPKLPIRFYIEAGKFENGVPCDLLGENRRFRDVLRAKGYDVTYSEFTGGHHFVSWRGSFADALIAVTKD